MMLSPSELFGRREPKGPSMSGLGTDHRVGTSPPDRAGAEVVEAASNPNIQE